MKIKLLFYLLLTFALNALISSPREKIISNIDIQNLMTPSNWKAELKPCENKGKSHSIAGIDFIYMVNLAVRPMRWQRSIDQLMPYGINPYRFDAINGWDINPSQYERLGCPHLHPSMNGGKVGCLLSFLSIISDAYYSGYETIWYMEDDIEVVEDPRQISDLVRQLDEIVDDWDILYTDMEDKHNDGERVPALAICPRPLVPIAPLEFYLRRIPVNETFVEIGMRYATYSMIIRRSGLKKILHYFTKYRPYLPIDLELPFVPGLKQVVLTKDVVSTLAPNSDTNFHYKEN